jgi:hypothetical protein
MQLKIVTAKFHNNPRLEISYFSLTPSTKCNKCVIWMLCLSVRVYFTSKITWQIWHNLIIRRWKGSTLKVMRVNSVLICTGPIQPILYMKVILDFNICILNASLCKKKAMSHIKYIYLTMLFSFTQNLIWYRTLTTRPQRRSCYIRYDN